MSTANEHNVSCSWRDLRFVDEIQNSEIDLLESLIATLAANCYFGDYRVIDATRPCGTPNVSAFREGRGEMRRARYPLSCKHMPTIISLPCGDSWVPINAGSEIAIQFKCVGF